MDLEEIIFDAFKNASPLVLVGAVLLLVLAALKKIPWFPDWCIPITSLFLGVVSYSCLTGWNPRNMILGLIIGGFPVSIHQTFKQILSRKKDVEHGDTEWFKKDTVITKKPRIKRKIK